MVLCAGDSPSEAEAKSPLKMSISRYTLLLAGVLSYAAGFRLATLNRPFELDAEGSGCLYGVLARNYLRFDLTQTFGMPVLTVGSLPDAPIVFYPDHPPLVPLLIVPFYVLFGVGEWQTRLPFSLVTVAAIWLVYRLLAHAATPRAGLLAAAAFAAMPMTLYFGGFPEVVGMPLVFFVLLSTIGYLHLHDKPGFRTFARLVGAFVLAGLCDWPAFLIVPIFLAHFVATQPRRQWPWIGSFCLVACALFAALYVYIALATQLPWDWMVPLLERRSVFGANPITLSRWLAAAWAFNRTYHTLPLLVAAGIWAMIFGLGIRHGPGTTVARLLLAWGILHVVIGSQTVHNHEWWWSPLTPGIAVAAALMAEGVLRQAERQGFARAASPIVAVLVALFASWTSYTTFGELYRDTRDRPFTPMELGRAIQAAAPEPSDVALLVGGEGADAQLWFYGDRALRTRVWSVEDLKRRLQEESVDLMFDFDVQPWKAAGTGFVFPRMWSRDLEGLETYLQQHYPQVPLPIAIAEKFEVFDLRRPMADTR